MVAPTSKVAFHSGSWYQSQRAIACNARRQRWQSWQARQRGICKLQVLLTPQVFESLSLRQIFETKPLSVDSTTTMAVDRLSEPDPIPE